MIRMVIVIEYIVNPFFPFLNLKHNVSGEERQAFILLLESCHCYWLITVAPKLLELSNSSQVIPIHSFYKAIKQNSS